MIINLTLLQYYFHLVNINLRFTNFICIFLSLTLIQIQFHLHLYILIHHYKYFSMLFLSNILHFNKYYQRLY